MITGVLVFLILKDKYEADEILPLVLILTGSMDMMFISLIATFFTGQG